MSTVPEAPLSLTVLCSRFRPERYGGVEECLWRLTNALARNGVHVQVITENRLNAPESETVAPGLIVRRVRPFDSGRLWRVYYAAYVPYWRRVTRQHAVGDVIWATDPTMALGAVSLRPRRRVIFNPAACAAGMRHIWEQRPYVESMHVPRHLLWVDRAAYKLADAMVVSSRNVEEQFRRFYGSGPPVHVQPFATDAAEKPGDRRGGRAAFGIAEQAFCVGFVGRLDPCKDLPFLLEAFARLGRDPADRLLIVGTGPDESRLKDIAAQRELTERIVWAGRLDDPSIAYSAMDVLVLPSVYEAFGLVLLEAMAAGVPVVGRAGDGDTVFTATTDIVSEESGFVVPADNIAALVDVLRLLKENPERRRAMGEAARRRVRGRSWDDLARECVAVAIAP